MQSKYEQFVQDEFINVSFFSLPELDIFQSIEKDSAGNYHFIKPGNGEKIQIIFRITPNGVLVGKEEEDEKCTATILGNEKKAKESILYLQNEAMGILRHEKESWFVEKLNKDEDIYMSVLTAKHEGSCKGDVLSTSNLSGITPLILADFIINKNNSFDKVIDFTVWNESLTGRNGLFSAISAANADKVLFLSLANEKDFSKDSGPAFVLKDGNYVLPQAERESMKTLLFQENFYVGKMDCIMEQLVIRFIGKKILGIYLPVAHYDGIVEEISLLNLEKTQDLLLKCIGEM